MNPGPASTLSWECSECGTRATATDICCQICDGRLRPLNTDSSYALEIDNRLDCPAFELTAIPSFEYAFDLANVVPPSELPMLPFDISQRDLRIEFDIDSDADYSILVLAEFISTIIVILGIFHVMHWIASICLILFINTVVIYMFLSHYWLARKSAFRKLESLHIDIIENKNAAADILENLVQQYENIRGNKSYIMRQLERQLQIIETNANNIDRVINNQYIMKNTELVTTRDTIKLQGNTELKDIWDSWKLKDEQLAYQVKTLELDATTVADNYIHNIASIRTKYCEQKYYMIKTIQIYYQQLIEKIAHAINNLDHNYKMQISQLSTRVGMAKKSVSRQIDDLQDNSVLTMWEILVDNQESRLHDMQLLLRDFKKTRAIASRRLNFWRYLMTLAAA